MISRDLSLLFILFLSLIKQKSNLDIKQKLFSKKKKHHFQLKKIINFKSSFKNNYILGNIHSVINTTLHWISHFRPDLAISTRDDPQTRPHRASQTARIPMPGISCFLLQGPVRGTIERNDHGWVLNCEPRIEHERTKDTTLSDNDRSGV